MADRAVMLLSTKGTVTSRQRLPVTGLFGIDMWHAVEFSRSGCASGVPAVQVVPGAAPQRYPRRTCPVKSARGRTRPLRSDMGDVAPRWTGLGDLPRKDRRPGLPCEEFELYA